MLADLDSRPRHTGLARAPEDPQALSGTRGFRRAAMFRDTCLHDLVSIECTAWVNSKASSFERRGPLDGLAADEIAGSYRG